MRNGLLLCTVLCLGGCQCHREPEPARTTAVTATSAGTPVATTPAETASPAALARARAESDAASAAVGTVHRYLTLLPGASRDQADALWSGGRPAPVPDDANLRQLQGIASLRVQNDAPVALDREQPPRAYEVPVRIVLQTTEGPQRFTGAYRLRARVDGAGWELTSAALQPTLGGH